MEQGMSMNDNEFAGFHVDLQKVAKERSMLSVTRALAADLVEHPYLSVGDFFKRLPTADVQTLLDVVEAGEYHPHFEELLLISQMLYTAEGLGAEIGTVAEATKRINALIGFIVCVSLERKNMVRVFYENMSFGEEVKDKIIVQHI